MFILLIGLKERYNSKLTSSGTSAKLKPPDVIHNADAANDPQRSNVVAIQIKLNALMARLRWVDV